MHKRLQKIIDHHTSLWPEIDQYGNGVYSTQVDTDTLVEYIIRDVCSKLDPVIGNEILEYYGLEPKEPR